MHILLSNDDGYRAPGLLALIEALRPLARLTVVAPERNRSGASNSLTLDRPLHLRQVDVDSFMVDGTPADCVYLALSTVCEGRPDLVVSGINAGENLGEDVLYSGTVAAAMEGALAGLPAIAVSLASHAAEPDFAAAAAGAAQFVRRLREAGLPRGSLLNVNFPADSSASQTIVTRLGRRHRDAGCIRQADPHGRPVYWIGPSGSPGFDAGPGTDFHAVSSGHVSVTPLQTDLTAYAGLEEVASWLREGVGRA